MKKMIFLGCLVLQMFSSTMVFAQEKIEAPIWNIEDKWDFKGKATMMVINEDESSYTVKSGTSIYIYEKSSLNILYSMEKDRRIKYKGGRKSILNFPLYIGKSWKDAPYTSRATHGTTLGNAENIYSETYTSLGWEDIIVEAGKFRAIKLEYKQEGRRERSWVGKGWYWYSPEVKNIVKCQYENSPVWIGIYDWELTSFKLKDKQPSPSEIKIPPQKVDIPQKLQSPLPEKPQTITPIISPPVTSMVVVTGTSANIRSGAGNEFPITATVKQGEKLTLLGERGEWFSVRLENGQEGWINNKFVK